MVWLAGPSVKHALRSATWLAAGIAKRYACTACWKSRLSKSFSAVALSGKPSKKLSVPRRIPPCPAMQYPAALRWNISHWARQAHPKAFGPAGPERPAGRKQQSKGSRAKRTRDLTTGHRCASFSVVGVLGRDVATSRAAFSHFIIQGLRLVFQLSVNSGIALHRTVIENVRTRQADPPRHASMN